MTEEQQIRLANAWAVNREAERRLLIRDFARHAAQSNDAYRGGCIFPVASPLSSAYFSESGVLPPAGTRYREIMVRLSPVLRGTPAARLIAERIIEEQWPEKA